MKPFKSPEIDLLPDESIDDFMGGRLRLIQSKKGYRSSIDAILLSDFVTVKKDDIITDLGTGCGIIPLILLLTRSVKFALGLEIQAELASQASRNIILNGVSKKMSVVLGDIRNPPTKESFSNVVVCNPPYRKRDSGRINPDHQRAIARHEMFVSLDDILNCAKRVLKAKGRIAMIYPAERLADLFIKMRSIDLEPKRLRIIYPGMESNAKLALLEASLEGRRGLKILPPLIGQGEYSIPGQV
jgi:tRNA1Val (adenine37-N6)-methyltransferase